MPLRRSGRARRRCRARSAALAAGVAVTLAVVGGACASTSAARAGSGASGVAAADGAPAFAPLNQAVGYGLLRLMTLAERPNPLDVVIYQELPNELPRVAGVVTTVGQTPLSHVNLRAVQDKVPNAVVGNLLADAKVTALIGKYVAYTVTDAAFTIEAATKEQVEAHHAALRPAVAQVPQRNLSIRTITPLADIAFGDWMAFGVKAANVATLRAFELPGVFVPNGYAVPFAFYDEFMRYNGLYKRVEKLLKNKRFLGDVARQERELADLRDAIKGSPMPGWMYDALTELQRSWPADTALRCRSSTNNEDLPNFSGAGLYDSKTQYPAEGHLSKCIKQVFASVWNLRAYLERDFYRIDHLATAMGVLVYPHFAGELANGVAVSADPVYGTDDAYYVNSQVGDDLVTNPEVRSIPEEMLIYGDGETNVVTHSNRVAPGETVLTAAQSALLKSSLAAIHRRFEALYAPAPGARFAMEIEFKILATGQLAIKQARTWNFASAA